MQDGTWWVNEPVVMATRNPTDQDLAQHQSQGFSVIFSFLDEQREPPRYDRESATAGGWTIYSIPVRERGAIFPPEVDKFIATVNALLAGTKILMHCESGLDRAGFMAAAYWIWKGMSPTNAIARVQQAAGDASWTAGTREVALHQYAKRLEVRRRGLV